MTSPCPFYFVFVPKEASNLSEVRFGDVAILKLFSVLHRKNSWKFSVYLLDLQFLVHMTQIISKLSLVEHFLIWATEDTLKIRHLSAILFWQISANICVCHFIAFFLSSFDHRTFGEVDTVVYTLYVVVLGWNLKQKGLILCYAYTNVANRFLFSFVWRKFLSVGIEEWWDELKIGQKLKLGDAHASPQEISKKYKHQILGMPPRHPFFIGKNLVTFQNTIFLLLHALCVFLGASVVFSFQFSLVLFAAINGWTTTNSFWRSCLAFHLPRTLHFSLYAFQRVFFFF
jgi:hypothetical protein